MVLQCVISSSALLTLSAGKDLIEKRQIEATCCTHTYLFLYVYFIFIFYFFIVLCIKPVLLYCKYWNLLNSFDLSCHDCHHNLSIYPSFSYLLLNSSLPVSQLHLRPS